MQTECTPERFAFEAGSLWPEEVGTTRKRTIRIDGQRLILSTPLYRADTVLPHDLLETTQIPGDEQLSNRLIWERVN
jgi:hypothetical protein